MRHAVTAVWGVLSGVAPHVLHHVGPLAGAAILAGTGGRLLFFFIGLGLATPMLIRLYRRFATWAAPAIAVAVFVAAYTVSSLYLGPLLTGEGATPAEPPSVTTTTDEHGH
jgi:peptidoglycan/LPS O-acetylase OafA/YrhL